jgi:very-short-patch-repair endonuclease
VVDLSQPFTPRMVQEELAWSTVRGPRFRRLLPGIYVAADATVTPELMARAALLAMPDSAWLSHTTSAALQGIPVPTDPRLHVSVPTAGDRRLKGSLSLHVRQRPRTALVRGLRVSVGAELFIELGEVLGLVDLVVAGDAMVRRGLVRPAQLVAAASDVRGAHAALTRRAASLVRARVDSPMETRLRLLIVLAGLPEPRVNPEVRDGAFSTRLDLVYLDLRLVIEYDGQQHRADDLDQWDRDNDRIAWFARRDYELVPVVARGIYRRPGETLARICDAIRRRGGVVPPLDPEWQLYFPGDG